MSGLYAGEQAVMDRFAMGLTASEIASELNISTARARSIISTFDDSPEHDLHREEAIRRKTRRFGHLIKRAGGHR